MREQWRERLQEWKKKLPLPALAVMAVGCLLLLLPVREPSGERQPEQEMQEVFELETFERRLEQVIAEIEGVGEARVILSLHGGSRQILAQDRQQDSAGASAQTVTVGSASDRQVVPIQTMAPDFRGALVVCRGADDAGVRLEVTKAVCVLTGLGTDCVCVTTGTS
jgi:stage III sporulation protein AG